VGSGKSRGSGESDDSRINDPNEMVAAALVSLGRSIAKEAAGRAVACNVVVSRSGSASTSSRARIVDAALYLASEDASFVNGELVEVM
jgi:hypothetical protein